MQRHALLRLLPLLFLCFLVPFSAYSQEEPAVGIVERLDQFVPDGIMLTNETGELVEFKSLIDKPTVVAFVYYNCPGICTPLMDGIAEVIGKVDMKLGTDYQVLTISFEPLEGYTLAARKKTNYMNYLLKQWEDQGITDSLDQNGWRFYTGDSVNVARVTDALGFKYKKVGSEYLHSGGLILLSKDAKIVRYINKTYFIPFEFKMALIEASEGRSGPTINKLLSYCYTYDSADESYVLNVTRVSGAIILFLALLILGSLVLLPKLRKKKEPKEQQA